MKISNERMASIAEAINEVESKMNHKNMQNRSFPASNGETVWVTYSVAPPWRVFYSMETEELFNMDPMSEYSSFTEKGKFFVGREGN